LFTGPDFIKSGQTQGRKISHYMKAFVTVKHSSNNIPTIFIKSSCPWQYLNRNCCMWGFYALHLVCPASGTGWSRTCQGGVRTASFIQTSSNPWRVFYFAWHWICRDSTLLPSMTWLNKDHIVLEEILSSEKQKLSYFIIWYTECKGKMKEEGISNIQSTSKIKLLNIFCGIFQNKQWTLQHSVYLTEYLCP
jgi:hypothetical protein